VCVCVCVCVCGRVGVCVRLCLNAAAVVCVSESVPDGKARMMNVSQTVLRATQPVVSVARNLVLPFCERTRLNRPIVMPDVIDAAGERACVRPRTHPSALPVRGGPRRAGCAWAECVHCAPSRFLAACRILDGFEMTRMGLERNSPKSRPFGCTTYSTPAHGPARRVRQTDRQTHTHTHTHAYTHTMAPWRRIATRAVPGHRDRRAFAARRRRRRPW
jgi:hypothetical protein